jgi:hypothetical protein
MEIICTFYAHIKNIEGKRTYEGLLRKEGSSFLVLCGVGILSVKASLIERLVKLLNNGIAWLIFKNTLRTSKLGSGFACRFDRIETTFLPTSQDLNPFFSVNAWKRATCLITGVRCRSSIVLDYLFALLLPKMTCTQEKQQLCMHATSILKG